MAKHKNASASSSYPNLNLPDQVNQMHKFEANLDANAYSSKSMSDLNKEQVAINELKAQIMDELFPDGEDGGNGKINIVSFGSDSKIIK